jgi:MoxR-like ATPase
MEERTVSIEGNHFKLPEFFIVMATQNPHMQIGTFDLPESQLDRFSMKIEMGYANKESTIDLLKNNDSQVNLANVHTVMSPSEILNLQKEIATIHVEDSILETIFNILDLTRHQNQYIPLSNRCGIDLVNISKAWAYMSGRDYVIPDDLFEIFPFIAGHRLVHPENSEIIYEHKLSHEILKKL